MAGRYRAKHFYFALGKIVETEMLCQTFGYLRRDAPPPHVNLADRIHQIGSKRTLQEVTGSAGFERSRGLHITGVGGQHDNSGLGKFATDRFDSSNSTQTRHLQI